MGTVAALVGADLAFAFQQTAIVPAIPAVQHDPARVAGVVGGLLTGYLVASSVATPLLGGGRPPRAPLTSGPREAGHARAAAGVGCRA